MKHFLKKFLTSLSDPKIGAYSAQTAFFIITSFFPFMLLLVFLLQFTPLTPSVIRELLQGEIIGAFTGDLLNTILHEATQKATPAALLGAAGISAIWAASRCLLSLLHGLNHIHNVKSKRGFLRLRLLSSAYVLLLQLTLIVSLGILVFGKRFGNVRVLLGFALLTLIFTFIYAVLPERKIPFATQLPGAALSAAGWLCFSWGFSVYIAYFPDYGAVYGSLTAAVILMLWLYFCVYILFAGAQFNVWLENLKKPDNFRQKSI